MSLFTEAITAEIRSARDALAAFTSDGDDAGVAVAAGRLEELLRIADSNDVEVCTA
jgi:hypothetical protein